MRAPRRLDVLERDRLAGVLLADGAADKAVSVEHPDLRQVARVEADRDRLADEAGKGRACVAQALEADAVALHDPGLGMLDQEQVKLLQAIGQARQEGARGPGLARSRAGPRVRAQVVGANHKGADRAVELGQRQPRRAGRPTRDKVPGQLRQELCRDGAEEALDFAPALRASHCRVDQPNTQIGRDLLQMVTGKVRAMIDVEGVGDAADCPSSVRLAPDRLPQRERGVERRGRVQEHHVARHRPQVIVDDRREPRSHGLTLLVQD